MSDRCRILYVDDHEDSAMMFEQLLRLSDYEVTTAASVEQALGLASSQEFDLYVLDRRLPDGMGVDLCRELKQLTPHVPVILYSGDAHEMHRLEGLNAGADAYVPKPYIDKLVEAIHQILSQSACAAAV
jgi:two-component system OmpR family response regulator